MLVEAPVPFSEVEDWPRHPGHEGESQCSTCGVGETDPWYKAEDVMMVRHWTTASVDEPAGGHWTWYCPVHFEMRAGNWWQSSHLAPARLLPEIVHACVRPVGLGSPCGKTAVEPFDGVWLCEQHAEAERVDRRIANLFADEEHQ